MNARDFAYWLQGAFELCDPKTLDEKQTDLIKRHLNLVFLHDIDPSHSDDPNVQGALQAIHDGVDINELREKLEDLKDFDPKSLEKQIKDTKSMAQKALRRPSGGGSRDLRMMC